MTRTSPAPPRAPPSTVLQPARPAEPSLVAAGCTASRLLTPRRSASPLRLPSPPLSPGVYRTPYQRLSASPPAAQHPTPSSARTRSQSPTTSFSALPPPLEVHGDSFASVFSLVGSRAKVFKYKGAAARGLNNPAAKLQVAQKLLARLEAARPPVVLLVFGTVDLAINYLWQLKTRGREAAGPQAWVKKVASDYSTFLASLIVPLAKRNGLKVYIAAAIPPVVEDQHLEAASQKYIEKQGAYSLPPLCTAKHPHDLATRSMMVKGYNSLVGAFCARHDCLAFIDISRQLVDPRDPRRVAGDFRDCVDPTNIHLLWEPTLPLWVRALPPLASLSETVSSPSYTARLARSREKYTAEKRERVRRLSWGAGAAPGPGASAS
ncbi:hypothetical protein JCM3770_001229 [Rhodotorula araucariae]